MVFINLHKFKEIAKTIEQSTDVFAVSKLIEEISNIPHLEMKLSLLEHAARHCGIEECTKETFRRLCIALEVCNPEGKAGQMGDMVFYGTKVPEISYLATNYVLDLVESGELSKHDGRVRYFLDFIIQNKKGEVVDRAKKIIEGVQE